MPLLSTLYPDIFEHIFDCLTGYELCRARKISKVFEALADSYSVRAFNLDRILSPYFSPEEIIWFRSIQRDHGVVISGSAVVQFFGRIHYPSSDLDVYADFRVGRLLAQFLVTCGYTFAPLDFQRDSFEASYGSCFHINHTAEAQAWNDYSGSATWGVFCFNKAFPNSFEKKQIQVIATRLPVLSAILQFHSTCVMGLITHAHAISLFPVTTFHEYQTVVASPNLRVARRNLAIQKYIERGWTATNVDDELEYNLHEEMRIYSSRRVGDQYCWTIRLPPLNPTSPTLEDVKDLNLIDSFDIERAWDEDGIYVAWMRWREESIAPYMERPRRTMSKQYHIYAKIWESLRRTLEVILPSIEGVNLENYSTKIPASQRRYIESVMGDMWLESVSYVLP